MRLWAAHAVFTAVLVGSLASRERSTEAPIDQAGLESVVVSVARSQGLGFREYRTNDTGGGRTMVFDVPGCSDPVLVTWRQATFEDAAAQKQPLDRTTSSSMFISIGSGTVLTGGRSQFRE